MTRFDLPTSEKSGRPGTASRNVSGRDLVSLERVKDISEFVGRTGAPEMVAKWRIEDGGKETGRPGTVSNHAIFVLLQLLVVEYESFSISAAAHMVTNRMTNEVRAHLGLTSPATKLAWESRIRRAYRRCEFTFDAFAGSRARRLTQDEAIVERARKKADPLHTVKQKRADEISDAFTFASMEYMSAEQLALWEGKFSIDGTAIPVCDNDRGSYKSREKVAVDSDADWHVRTGSHRVDGDPKPLNSQRVNDEYKFGYEADFLVWTTNNPEAAHAFAYVCPTMRLKKPGHIPAELALDMVQAMVKRGYRPTLLGSDQGIVPKAAPAKLQVPLYDMGIEVCCNYGQGDRGNQGGYKGLIWVEGHPYCESMPERLVNAVTNFNDSHGDMDKLLAQIEERERYLAKPNGKPNKDGGVQYLHPTDHGHSVCDSRRPGAPKFCRQKSIVVPKEFLGLKRRQKYRYLTAEWFREHYTGRSTNEGFNGFISDKNREALEDYSKRTIPGYTATYLAVAMKVVSANFRKIARFESLSTQEAAAIERKRARRREGSSHERFYEQKYWISRIQELNTRTGRTSLLE